MAERAMASVSRSRCRRVIRPRRSRMLSSAPSAGCITSSGCLVGLRPARRDPWSLPRTRLL